MSEALRYAVVFEKSADGWGAFMPDLPGCVSVGDTLEGTERVIRETIADHIAVSREFGDVVPETTTFAKLVEIPAAVGF